MPNPPQKGPSSVTHTPGQSAAIKQVGSRGSLIQACVPLHWRPRMVAQDVTVGVGAVEVVVALGLGHF